MRGTFQTGKQLYQAAERRLQGLQDMEDASGTFISVRGPLSNEEVAYQVDSGSSRAAAYSMSMCLTYQIHSRLQLLLSRRCQIKGRRAKETAGRHGHPGANAR